MKFILLALVKIYRLLLSPFLHTICGPGCGCRFTPSCSEYFEQSVRLLGPWRGGWLALKRIGRCHPWGGSGYDPVPTPAASPHTGGKF